jgi:PAS domain S-box-containing protein
MKTKRRRLRDLLTGTLRGRLILGVAAVHALMMSLFILDSSMRQRSVILDNQITSAAEEAQSLAASAESGIAADDVAGLQEIVDGERDFPELLFAALTDERGFVLANTDRQKVGLSMLDLPAGAGQEVLHRSADLVDVAVPVVLGGWPIGWARVGIGQKGAASQLRKIIGRGVLYAAVAVVVGSLIAWLLGRAITRRLYAVQDTIRRVKGGHPGARVTIAGADEAASIGHEINAMLDSLDARSRELSRSDEKYRMLARAMPAAVVVHGTDTRVRMCNPMAQALLGLTEQQASGMASADEAWHFARDDGSTLPVDGYPVNRVLGSGRPLRDLVVGVRTGAGHCTWVQVNADPVLDESGGVAEVIVTFVEISERKRIESELREINESLEKRVHERTADLQKKSDELGQNQAALVNIVEDLNEKTALLEAANDKLKDLDRLKSLFIASMSHELRTPLNSIIGFSSITLNEWTGALTPEQRANLTAILRSGRHLLALVNDVIDVSKIEAGKLEATEEEFNAHDVVVEAMTTFAAEAEAKHLRVDVHAPDRQMRADRRRLLQCLLNLVSNAVKYTDRGCITVRVDPAKDGRLLEFSVEDTGIGIKSEDVQRLFSPFIRILSPGRPLVPGTGLGLYLTRKLAQDVLRGDIAVTSEPGKGSRFVLQCPLAAPETGGRT